MTDREKLIELIEENDRRCCGAICEVCSYTKEGEVCQSAMLADHLIANGVTVQDKLVEIDQFGKWIPVTERLPEVGSRVIACGEKGGVFIVKAEGETTGFGRMDGASKYRSFTHWMPLPEPPKEGEHG